MDKTKSLYAIYKYDFHAAKQRLVQAEADGVDGSKYVKIAQNCFASLFDENTIDNLAKINKKGEATRLPNDIMAKVGDIFIWRVNNSQIKEWWKRSGKDSRGIDKYDFVRDRIYEHDDYVRKVSFTFQNPKKINKTNAMEVKSARLKAMLRTVEISDALKGFFMMEFDKNSTGKVSQENKDMAEMVRLCGENGYDICITFKEYKTYRINDYVKAFYPMSHDVLQRFGNGHRNLDGKTELEDWFDLVEEETRGYVNESEVPKRRHKAHR